MKIQICDWMRGSVVETRTRFERDQVLEVDPPELFRNVAEIFATGLNVMLQHVDPKDHTDNVTVRVWVDTKRFGQR